MSQLVVVAYDADDRVIDATEVQTAGILDMLFAYNGELGSTLDGRGVSFKLWAPTAQRVRLHVFDASKRLLPGYPKPMRGGSASGAWKVRVRWIGSTTSTKSPPTDPAPAGSRRRWSAAHALSLSRNSQYARWST